MTVITTASRIGIAAIIALAIGIVTVSAAGGGAEVTTSQVSWTIDAANCDDLAAGTTIEGEGTLKSVTIVRESRDGIITVINSSHAFGTATDGDGNEYRWSYSNAFRISNSLADPGTLSGTMTDHFSLAGSGPAGIVAGFIAAYTEVGGTFSFVPQHVVGDPLDFAAGTSRCDPL